MKLLLCTQILATSPPPHQQRSPPFILSQLLPSLSGYYDSWPRIPGRVLNDIHLTSSPMVTDIKNNGYDSSCSGRIVPSDSFPWNSLARIIKGWKGGRVPCSSPPPHLFCGTRGIYSPSSAFIQFFKKFSLCGVREDDDTLIQFLLKSFLKIASGNVMKPYSNS